VTARRRLTTAEDLDAWTRGQVDRLRIDRRTEIAAALDLGAVGRALQLVAAVERVARSVELHSERSASELLYAIAHECSARRSDAAQFRRVVARGTAPASFPPSPSMTPRAPAARVSRPVQTSLGLEGAIAAPQSPSSAPEQPGRLAPWQRRSGAL
jgi:hypothetical protein